MDIFYRTFDGASWSAPADMIPQPDSELDEIPKACVYRNPVSGQDELWVSWIRGDPSTHVLHIMARMFDGSSWGQPMELTDPATPRDNMGVEMLEYDGRLYAVWVTGTNTTTENGTSITIYSTYGHIVIRAYDGWSWSDIVELTPIGQTDNANSPTLAVFNDRLYAAWAFPYPAVNGAKETWDIIARNIDFRPVELELRLGDAGISAWGPAELGSTNETIALDCDAFQRALAASPRLRDAYGNEYCDLSLRLCSTYPSRLWVGDLHIEYSLTVRLDNMSSTLNGLLWNGTGLGRGGGGNTTVPFSLTASSAGGMRVHDLNISYVIDLPPMLVVPIPDLHLPEDTDAVHLIDLDQFFWDDWDAGNLQYVVTFEERPDCVHAVVDGHYLTFTTPTENWNGAGHFRVRAYDRARLWADSNPFCITVDPVNDPPVLDPIPARGVEVGQKVYFEVHAIDVDGDPLTFSTDDSQIPVVPIGQRTGRGYVSFQPLRAGNIRLNITVDDGNGGTDSKIARIIVIQGVSSGTDEPCFSWLIVIILTAGAVAAVAWFRRRALKETGPIIGPAGEFTDEEVFGGLVAVKRDGGEIEGSPGESDLRPIKTK